MSRRQAGSLVPLNPAAPREPAGQASTLAQASGVSARPFPLVIVDPQNLFRRGLALLVRQWYPDASVLDAGDIGRVLHEMGQRVRPELLIVDAMLACRWNFSGLNQLLARLPSTPIVLLADEPDANAAFSAVELGVRGYLAKSASEEVLRHALALAMAGEIYLPREQFDQAAGHSNASPCGVGADSPLQRLTYRQREVLSHLALGRSNKQAAMLAVEMGWARRLDA